MISDDLAHSQCKHPNTLLPITWKISHSHFDTRSVLDFSALTTTKASDAMMNAGFYFESAGFWWCDFTSVNPTCCSLPATDRFLDHRGLKSVFSALSDTVFLISTASLLHPVLYPWLSSSFLLSHFEISLFSHTCDFLLYTDIKYFMIIID